MAKSLSCDRYVGEFRNTLARFVLVLLILLAYVFISSARSQTTEKAERRIVQRVQPEYPKTLKDARIGGLVRMNVTVLANGTVAHVETTGGNPILGECATKAVRQWKYAPAAATTKEELLIHFNP